MHAERVSSNELTKKRRAALRRRGPRPETTGMQHRRAKPDCPLCGLWGVRLGLG